MGNSLKKLNVLILGLDGAGKTTILYFLKLREPSNRFQPTAGFNYEVVDYNYSGNRFRLSTWDLGGGPLIRSMWKHYYNNMDVDVLLYVIDGNDRSRMPEARMEFHRLLSEAAMRETLAVLFVNVNEDAAEPKMKEREVRELMGFRELKHIDPKVVEVNALNGDGFATGLDYICASF